MAVWTRILLCKTFCPRLHFWGGLKQLRSRSVRKNVTIQVLKYWLMSFLICSWTLCGKPRQYSTPYPDVFMQKRGRYRKIIWKWRTDYGVILKCINFDVALRTHIGIRLSLSDCISRHFFVVSAAVISLWGVTYDSELRN